MTTIRAILADMQATARAHEQWAMSPEALASEATMSTVFASQIRTWMTALGLAQAVAAVDPVATSQHEPPTRENCSLQDDEI